ncbi:MAG: DUF1343 domain-containing protein [Bacteroidota bacterium]
MEHVFNGIDVWLNHDIPFWKGRWGLATNNAACTKDGQLVRTALLQAEANIICLFSPEHGITAMGADGAAQADGRDTKTGIPIRSLYGNQLLADLSELDGVIFDLPDIGLRFYTYIWTLSYLMEACAKANKRLIILDRVNPLSGCFDLVEGPYLDESLSSFIGRWRLPIRHSLTVGELAQYWKYERSFDTLPLEIVSCKNWKRNQFLQDTDLPFIRSSPGINHPDTLLLYPALCFLEGVNVNEGRGTPYPFRQFGAPWLDNSTLADFQALFNAHNVSFIPTEYVPVSGRYSGRRCNGFKLSVNDVHNFRPVAFGLHLIRLLFITHSSLVKLTAYPTWANPSGARHLLHLIGDLRIFESLVQLPNGDFEPKDDLACPRWEEKVAPFLLYK